MSASTHRFSCSQLGACQARPNCAECGYPVGECQAITTECTRVHSEGHVSALQILDVVNQRAQHTGLETQVHRVTPRADPAPDPLEPPPREHAPHSLALFWAGYMGFSLVFIGLALAHVWAR